jgi:hypothetical protein
MTALLPNYGRLLRILETPCFRIFIFERYSYRVSR